MNRPLSSVWTEHEFYSKALVLGIDVGIEGIGVWLRKGGKPLFAHTFLVSLPEAAPLAKRRAKRAWRHARDSRQHREKMLKEWIVAHGILSKDALEQMWAKPEAFDRAFEHRHRAITTGIPSPHCLVICIRHLVKHRGFDYHLTEEGAYPWGEELDAKEITEWAKHAPCAPEYRASLLVEIESDAPWAKDKDGEHTDKYLAVVEALDRAVKEYENHPIEKMLTAHMVEKNHPNLRERGRTHNFPRELVKEHLAEICERHRQFLTKGTFEQAMRELLGEREEGRAWKVSDSEPQAILDYHRRTRAEAELLWLRKTKDCPFAESLHEKKQVPKPNFKCDLRSNADVRRFNLAMFLAERRVEMADAANSRVHLPVKVIEAMFEDLDADIKATADMLATKTGEPPQTPMERPPKPRWTAFKKRFEDLKLAGVGKDTFNADFFDQLADLVRPELRSLRGRASLCGASAKALHDDMTEKGKVILPEKMRANLKTCGYYDLRKDQDRSPGIYPQVEFLLGQRKQYDDDGVPSDVKGRKDGQPQHHGVLRKLFAGQLRLDDGSLVDLSAELDGEKVPEFVVVETIGDMPRNEDERREMQKENKLNRARKNAIVEKKYKLKLSELSDSQVRRVLLFDQQANEAGEALSPYSGKPLGKNPLDPNLHIEHIFPEKRGGIWIMDNLAITTRDENNAKGNQTPFEWLGRNVGAHLTLMHWNKSKRVLFCREESECPQWDNITRMAQIARHLRGEVIHWLGIRRKFAGIADAGKRAVEISKEIAVRIGTPVGGQTAACREVWLPPTLFPQMYREGTSKSGRKYWMKNRLNLRHHLWDAATLAHIPPGVGMNSVDCGGIFRAVSDASGNKKITVLPGFGPDLCAFEKETAGRCLVSKPRQAKSKKSRYKETIISLPDVDGKRWAREPLGKLTAKALVAKNKGEAFEQIRKLFDRPGLLRPEYARKGTRKGEEIAPLLTLAGLKAWWEGVQSLQLDREGLLALLGELGIERASVPPAGLDSLFTKSEKRAFNTKPLIGFIRKQCKVNKEKLADARIEEVMNERATKAELRGRSIKPGKLGQPIRSIRVEQDKMFFFSGHRTPEGKEPIGGVKAVNNVSSVIYLRREIWAGKCWKGKGGKKAEVTFYEHRLIPHPRHLASYQKVHGVKLKMAPPPNGMKLVCTLAVGDLLRVPITADGDIAKRGQPYANDAVRFYRISALETSGRVEMKLAEWDAPKIPKGKAPTREETLLLAMHTKTASKDEDLARLHEFTTGKVVELPSIEPLPPPAVRAASKREGELPGLE
jgi:hypothetical protein